MIAETQTSASIEPNPPGELPGVAAGSLFARWFWLVYVPLGLFVTLLILAFTGLLPRPAILALMAFSLWSAIAVRLLVERSRRGLEVPVPRSLVGGLSWVSGLATTGAVLGWMGLARLSSDFGLALGFSGIFLLVLALIAPIFKLIDIIVRSGTRTILKRVAMAAKRRESVFKPEPVEVAEQPEATPPSYFDDIVITRFVGQPRPAKQRRIRPRVEEESVLEAAVQATAQRR